jgi:2-oxoglutarate dehydrogenase complex dehydrogenase (E1) component-like enzyme
MDYCVTVADLKTHLKKLYTQSVGVEFNHVETEKEKLWLYKNYERLMLEEVNKAEKLTIFSHLLRAEQFELFIHKKFPGYKRYSGEGAETLIAALNTILAEASYSDHERPERNIKNVVIGMPHRGRLSTI